MEGRSIGFIVLIIFILLVSPDTQRASPTQRLEHENLLNDERHALDVLNHTRHGDFSPTDSRWINITGLRSQDGYAWDLLPEVLGRAGEQVLSIIEPWKDGTLGQRYTSTGALEGRFEVKGNLSSADAPETSAFYQNVTGLIHGKWVRSVIGTGYQARPLNLTALSPNVRYSTEAFDFNITGSGGDLTLRFDQKRSETLTLGPNSARQIKAQMTIQDESSSGDGWDITLYGVHFPQAGSILLATSSAKFAGIFALPQFARSKTSHDLAQQLLNATLYGTIVRQEAANAMTPYPWASSLDSIAGSTAAVAHCEYIVYLQQHIIPPQQTPFDSQTDKRKHSTVGSLLWLENELRYPTGASLDTIPEIVMSAVIFSPDCAFVLESQGPPEYPRAGGNHLQGLKSEARYSSVRRVVQALGLVIGAQVWLLIRQMKDASTPSTRSRVSFYTVAIMALADGFVCISFLSTGLLMDPALLTIASTAFVAFLSVGFFSMKFLMDIYAVQAPERLERRRQRERRLRERRENEAASVSPSDGAATATAPTSSVVSTMPVPADTLPLPVTARRSGESGATPIVILPPDQDLDAAAVEDEAAATTVGTQNATQNTLGNARREMSAMYSKFYFTLLLVVFLSLSATSWPIPIRSAYANLLAFVYLSLWIPQIQRNVGRNCRKALRWEFVAGQSGLRSIPIAYFYFVEGNVLLTKTDPHAMYALLGWVWVQVWVLIGQEVLGPRFFVPAGWVPPAYDYHPILREDDEEAGPNLPIGFMQGTAKEQAQGDGTGEAGASGGQRSLDCAICMQNIDVPVVPRERGDGASAVTTTPSLFLRRTYMVTPCRHVFHSVCLEGWMKYRLQCPICRDSLPPL